MFRLAEACDSGPISIYFYACSLRSSLIIEKGKRPRHLVNGLVGFYFLLISSLNIFSAFSAHSFSPNAMLVSSLCPIVSPENPFA
ncbi:hypothetical protein L1887_33604 [Cichorium endivia]|nr:hypothetical protein L1887_33604 [Cichorium endivia]